MTHHRFAALATAALISLSAAVAAADTTYDTVEAVETIGDTEIKVTGIIAGQSTPTETIYELSGFNSTEKGNRCDRLALLAMSKPGKFRLVMVDQQFQTVSCKLILRTP